MNFIDDVFHAFYLWSSRGKHTYADYEYSAAAMFLMTLFLNIATITLAILIVWDIDRADLRIYLERNIIYVISFFALQLGLVLSYFVWGRRFEKIINTRGNSQYKKSALIYIFGSFVIFFCLFSYFAIKYGS